MRLEFLGASPSQLAGWIVVLLGGGLATKAVDIAIAKRKEKKAQPADMTRAAGEFMDSLSGGGKDLMEFFRDTLKGLTVEVENLKGEVQVAHMEASRANEACAVATDNHAKCEVKLLSLQGQIDEMMKGRDIPGYTELRRVVVGDKDKGEGI